VAHRQRGAPPWRGGWNVGIDQLKEPQFLRHGIEQCRGPKLRGLHRVERGHCPRGAEAVRWTRICSMTRS